MFRHLPPSGSPIKTKELLEWIKDSTLRIDRRHDLTSMINNKFNVDFSYLLSTGRGAMVLLLKSLRDLANANHRNEVVVPAYTCYSVASSIIKAGLKIRICDIDPETLSYNIDQLKNIPYDNVLCILTANLYGLPNQLTEIEMLAEKHNVYLIDDAAQSINSKYKGRYAGTFGIAGIYSLDKGKNITSIDGGIIVTRSKELSNIIDERYKELDSPTFRDNVITTVKILIYYFLLNPYVYWLPANLPFLKLGDTIYDDKYLIKKYSSMFAPIALLQLSRVDSITASRVGNGLWYDTNLSQNTIIKKITVLESALPAYLRYPIRVLDRNKRDLLVESYKKYGVTISYPNSLDNLDEIAEHVVGMEKCHVAEQVANELITLPTHIFVKEEDRLMLCNTINELSA
ncbi:MAG: DegT/DnrJ/EryC1/StrS family aminotransferase [Candidatus Thiodiazotropha sp. (ex Troendleina suluensis)]|nr:DegT/DnrJ/EryC1/StrS family aminotransferase [Candidatus Thiodiazotropha sp. (ex Troendleina suluensis)]